MAESSWFGDMSSHWAENASFVCTEGGTVGKTHHGGKVGSAASTLANPKSSKSAKSGAAKTLANHKHNCH